MPSITHPWWLLAPLLALLAIRLGRRQTFLPGSWQRAIEPSLRELLATGSGGARRRPAALALAGLWLLLGTALASVSFGQTAAPSLRNLYARVVVIDLGLADSSADRVSAARYLIESAGAVPTAVVAVTAYAFDVVPLTRDRAHLDRYLQVLSPAIMPVQGRSLLRGIERAVELLDRAHIQARQIAVVTGGAPPSSGSPVPGVGRDQNIWLVLGDGAAPGWDGFAAGLDATILSDRDTATLDDDLERRRQDAASGVIPIRQRRDLTPWLIALMLPLWLLAFFRRRSD